MRPESLSSHAYSAYLFVVKDAIAGLPLPSGRYHLFLGTGLSFLHSPSFHRPGIQGG